ncbi:MAG: HPr(Ser) kinase/phosphatase [Erysipelotrichaceae bacterium]
MEEFGKAHIKDLQDFFQFTQITGDENSLERWVIIPDINRPGLELTGYFAHSEPRRIVIIGHKELSYMQTQNEDVLRERLEYITDKYTPAIIIAKGLQCPSLLKDIAEAKNFPIFSSPLPTYQLMVDVISYLGEKLAPTTNIHGVLLSVYGKGVLMTGDSGIGKSETALELIRKGHILVADDQVDVYKIHNYVFGKAPELLIGMLEIRGIGVIDVAKMFGASSIMSKNDIDLIVHLEQWDDTKDYARLGIEEELYLDILNIKIPKVIIPIREGRNIAVLVESAVTNFNLKQMGINSSKDFEKRVYDYIKKQSEDVK